MTVFSVVGARPNVMRASPVHRANVAAGGSSIVVHTGSAGCREFLGLLSGGATVVTDSGGIQDGPMFLGVPCVAVRESTERPIPVTVGTDGLAPLDADRVAGHLNARLADGDRGETPSLWDGRAAEGIAAVLLATYDRSAHGRQAGGDG